MARIIHELKGLTYLKRAKARKLSGAARTFLPRLAAQIIIVAILGLTVAVAEQPSAPITVPGRPEAEAVSPRFSYAPNGVHAVDGRQGIAWDGEGCAVSGSTTLTRYDSAWNLIAEAADPFSGFADEVNHIGDIDVYAGELYAGVEYFMDGEARNIQIAVYDEKTLELTRTYAFDAESGQREVSGIAVDPDSGSIWLCSWAEGESGRYLYRYDLESGAYLGKHHLQPAPQWIQGIAYDDGWIYMTADDGTADLGEPDHVYRCRADISKTAWPVALERTLDDVTLQGEVEGISFDRENNQMLVSYNRGAQIVLGMPKGFYQGYDSEIHEVFAYERGDAAIAEIGEAYTLDRMVVLSRHNIRSPLSGSGSLLGDITPHEWFQWTSNPSELSLRGAMLETLMGQYFRLWLEEQGLFPENYRPEDGAVRFYANAKQRTLATARYFSAGLLPVADVPIESHGEYDTMDPTFSPVLTYVSEAYNKAVLDQIAEKGGVAGLNGIRAGLSDAIALLMDVADMDQSEAYQSGTCGDLLEDETTVRLELGREPAMSGPIKTATSVADAMTFQFYEMADDKAAAFGHDLTIEDWRKLHTIVDTYTDILFGTPLLSANVAHPLLQEIRGELTNGARRFSFLCGHDSNVASVLSALGVEEYLLPETVEQHTPIGVKLTFSRWLNEGGEAYYTVELIYQSTEQLRGLTPLSLDNPPMRFALHFDGVPENEDGMIAEADLMKLMDGTIDAYDALAEEYGTDAALAPAA